jgi:predicted methyltransferase
MTNKLKRVTAVSLLVFLAACSGTPERPFRLAQTLPDVISGSHRSQANRARDSYRHPLETLEFFGVEPGMTVMEVWPGGGWYTEILAPYLQARGTYIAAGFVTSAEGAPQYRRDLMVDFRAMLAARPDLYGRVSVVELGRPDSWDVVPADSVDRVLTFRNVHNWISGGYEREMFQAFYRALKPGGVLGVVEHRADPAATIEQMKKSGYVTEDYVIRLAEAAGLRLQARSEVNANPRDTKNHPEGVWTLPPSLRLGNQDREKYLAIGESDRMTLKFVKPLLIGH